MTTTCRITISASPARLGDARRAADHVGSAVAKLLGDLGLPIAPTVETEDAREGADVRAIVDGRVLPVPVTPDADSDAFADAIIDRIFRARELFVTEEVTTELLHRWTVPVEDDRRSLITKLCRDLVRYGFRADRMRDALTACAPESFDRAVAGRILEDVLDGPATGAIRIRVGRERSAELAHWTTEHPEGLARTLLDRLYFNMGVVSRIELTSDESLPPSFIELGWHDITAPAIKRGSLEDALRVLDQLLRVSAGSWVSRGLVELYLLRLQRLFPKLVENAQRLFPVLFIAATLRALVDEGLSIRDTSSIIGCMLAVDGTSTADFTNRIVFMPSVHVLVPTTRRMSVAELTAEDYAEAIRAQLKRYISNKYSAHSRTLSVYLLAPQIETMLARSGDPKRVLDAIHDASPSPGVAILTTAVIRRPLSELVRYSHPDVPVLSYNELSPDLSIQPLARIGEFR